MAAKEFLAALRPAARVLILLDEKDEKSASLLPGRGKSVPPLARVTDLALALGHRVQVSAVPVEIDEAAPEVVLFDGGARDVSEQIRSVRAAKILEGAVFVVLLAPKTRDEILDALRLAGADEFLGAEATDAEIQARLESAVTLGRARAEIADLRAQLSRQTRVDELTGVMSRRFFFQQAHRECSRARRYGHKFTCLMLEVDHFKMLCGTYGEALGEDILRAVATIIGQWTRDSDLVSRFGEAKFAILLPETGIEGATAAREKIMAALQKHEWKHQEQPFPMSVSVGEAELTPNEAFRRTGGESHLDGDDGGEVTISTREALAELLEDADAALFIARKGARVPVVFVPYVPSEFAPDERSSLIGKMG